MNICAKPQFKGQCCCNCKYQVAIHKHPWNKGKAKGSILKCFAYGCLTYELQEVRKQKRVIYFDNKHGVCELWTKR